MRHLTFISTLLLAAVLGCKKSEVNHSQVPTPDVQLLFGDSYSCLNNSENAYDLRGVEIRNLWIDVITQQYPVENGLQSLLNEVSNSLSSLSWSIPDDSLSDNEIEYFNIIHGNMSYIEPDSLSLFLTRMIAIEAEINEASNLSTIERERLLTYASIIRQTGGYMALGEIISGPIGDYERKLNDCIDKKLTDIFENGNWIDKTAFIVGLPESWLYILASCGWDSATTMPAWQDFVYQNYVQFIPQNSSCE